MASVKTIDFREVPQHLEHASGINRDAAHRDLRPETEEGKLLTAKQIRARARRRAKRPNGRQPLMSEVEFNALYKPIDEWTMEELAFGRPKHPEWGFKGAKPKWITAEIHERSMELFTAAIKTEMSAQTITAVQTLQWIMNNETEDGRGKPLVPPSTKLEAAKFLLEHVVGKPTQRVEADISVKLQGILAQVLVNPNDALAPPSQGGFTHVAVDHVDVLDVPSYEVAHFPGHTIPIGLDDVDDSDNDLDMDE